MLVKYYHLLSTPECVLNTLASSLARQNTLDWHYSMTKAVCAYIHSTFSSWCLDGLEALESFRHPEWV